MFKKLLLLFFVTVPSYTIDPQVKKDIAKKIDLIYKDFDIVANAFLDVLLTSEKAYNLAENFEEICDVAYSLSKEDNDELAGLLNEFFSKITRKIESIEKNNKWQILVKKYGKFGNIRRFLASPLDENGKLLN